MALVISSPLVANILPITNLPMASENLPIAANVLPLVPIGNDIRNPALEKHDTQLRKAIPTERRQNS